MGAHELIAIAIGGYAVLQVAAIVVWVLRRPARRAAAATRGRAEARGWAALRRACLRRRAADGSRAPAATGR